MVMESTDTHPAPAMACLARTHPSTGRVSSGMELRAAIFWALLSMMRLRLAPLWHRARPTLILTASRVGHSLEATEAMVFLVEMVFGPFQEGPLRHTPDSSTATSP